MYIQGLPYYIILNETLKGLNEVNYIRYEFEVEHKNDKTLKDSINSTLKFYRVEHKEGKQLIYSLTVGAMNNQQDYIYYCVIGQLLRGGLSKLTIIEEKENAQTQN